MPFQIVRNDITKMHVDAIVNAANTTLLGGGGVDGAIHRAAGPGLLQECKTLGGCQTGSAKLTAGYALPCKYVIHTVGPVWRDGHSGEKALLESCYRESLRLCQEKGCQSVAFPLISAGAYGYPKNQALKVAVDVITAFLLENEMQVYLVVFDRTAFTLSENLFEHVSAYIDQHYVDIHRDRRERSRRLECMAAMEMDTCESCAPKAMYPCTPKAAKSISLEDMLSQADAGFSETLLRLIDKKGKKDSEVYKKANLSKQHFSKIRNNPDYKPTKPTAVALALALELDIEETKDLIGRAGYALTNSSKFDLIIRFFIEQNNYNVVDINLALFEHDQNLLGS